MHLFQLEVSFQYILLDTQAFEILPNILQHRNRILLILFGWDFLNNNRIQSIPTMA